VKEPFLGRNQAVRLLLEKHAARSAELPHTDYPHTHALSYTPRGINWSEVGWFLACVVMLAFIIWMGAKTQMLQ